MNPWLERRPLLVAHRGGALEAPENTVHAFRHGTACGAEMLELDVHATADGEIVVLHDQSLDRTTDGSGLVAHHDLAAVEALDAAHWFVPGCGAMRGADHYPLRGIAGSDRSPLAGLEPAELRVPTLATVLQTFPDTWITMELKVAGLGPRVAALLDAHGRADDVIVGGFDLERLTSFRETAPHVATSASEEEAAAFWSWAHGHGPAPTPAYRALQVPQTYEGVDVVTPTFVERAHELGIPVHVWTVDDVEDLHRLVDLGVDGIMTDRPGLLGPLHQAQ